MANELRFIETLDSSGFEKGVAQSTASMRKMAEEANLASKGIQGMFDSQAMAQAKEQFAGVEAIVKRFTSAMSRELPMKREMRETSMAAQGLEQIWRNLSAAEKQSAGGQELRAKIDALIQRGGVLRDTMGDVSAAMKFQSSDTAKLDAVVGGIQAMTAAAQVAAGTMKLLGMNEKEAAEVQAELMAIMSVVNGLQTIQNALQRESAVMQGLLAVKTSALAAATSLKAAVTKADTTATKAATAAQWLWNTAIAANPIGALIVAVGAAAAAIYALASRESDAAKQSHELTEALSQQSSQFAESRARLERLRQEWETLTNDNQRKEWITDNAEEFKKLDVEVLNVADAENLLVNNTGNFIRALKLRAQAAAVAALAQEKFKAALEERAKANDRLHNPTAYDKTIGAVVNASGFSLAEGANRSATLAAAAGFRAADAKDSEGEALIRLLADLEKQISTLRYDSGFRSYGTTTTSPATRKGRTSSSSTSKSNETPTVVGSMAYYDEEISKLQKLAQATADAAESRRLFNQAAILQYAKSIKFEGEIPNDWLPRFNDRLNEQLANAKINLKIPRIASLEIQTPLELAKEKSDQLLESTQGLRTAATAAAGAFRSMGDAIGGNAGKAVNVAAMMAQAIVTMIQGYAQATLQAGKLSPWYWLAFGLTGLGQLMAMISAVKSAGAFATGGIVGGTSYSGDRNLIRVNSGEMILNRGQQASLWNAINGGGVGGGNVTFRISGQELVGVLNNYNSKMSKVR